VSSPPLAVGQRIDGFELLEHRHRGGMASLWRVTRPDLELPAVMKVPAIHDDPTTIVGFEVEQMIMPLLSGPHVPRFIVSGGFEAQPYIVMEYIEGATLRSRLDESPLPASEVAAIGAAIAEALHDLHHQHVIHLDVKPSNIMFRPDGHVVLIDYGLARHEKLPDLLAEEFRLPLGTSPYISPEQVLYVRDDPRSDLFALGATLYHTWPPGSALSARPLRSPACASACTGRPFRHECSTRTARRGCRRSSCTAWRSTRNNATARPRRSHLT
jgi:eukaryotic-like serine/threonine-protein kinase